MSVAINSQHISLVFSASLQFLYVSGAIARLLVANCLISDGAWMRSTQHASHFYRIKSILINIFVWCSRLLAIATANCVKTKWQLSLITNLEAVNVALCWMSSLRKSLIIKLDLQQWWCEMCISWEACCLTVLFFPSTLSNLFQITHKKKNIYMQCSLQTTFNSHKQDNMFEAVPLSNFARTFFLNCELVIIVYLLLIIGQYHMF